LLLSNRSLCTDFLLVRCDSWNDGNVVLLGGAAHTVHFSIGSGTKLAMEDAIALSQAFVRHPGDVERALVARGFIWSQAARRGTSSAARRVRYAMHVGQRRRGQHPPRSSPAQPPSRRGSGHPGRR
jgi:anthraniloyl-CoA monooxygenase